MGTIPYARQDINQEDIDAVIAVLSSDFLTQGPIVPAFEKAIMDYCGSQYAIAVNSATSALHIACLALGVCKGDLVWTSPITFVASANCALYCGATVDFVDIDPLTYNLSVDRLSEKLALAKIAGNLPKVLIAVHLCGQSCDMANIYALSQIYGFRIIEDASHAIGGKYRSPINRAKQSSHFEPIGNGRYSDITVFSFHPVKIITTGEGGMAVTNNKDLAKHMRLLRSHGISDTKEDFQYRSIEEIWNYQQINLGFNYRMTDIQAALGLCQMKRLNSFIEKRHQIAIRYDEELSKLPIKTPWQHIDTYSSYHLYPVRIRSDKNVKNQRQIYNALRSEGINVNVHYIPVYRQPYYETMKFREGYCLEAERYYKETLSLPIYSTLTDTEQTKVIQTLHEILK